MCVPFSSQVNQVLKRSCSRVRPDDTHDLQAQHPVSTVLRVRFDPGVRQSPQSLPLTFIDGVEGVPEVRASSRLHFDEAEHATVFGDDVEFTLRAPPVPVDNVVTACRQIVRGVFFTRASEVVFGCHENSMIAGGNPRIPKSHDLGKRHTE